MDKGELFTNNKLSIQIKLFKEDHDDFIDIGSFRHWHYSKELFNETDIKNEIEQLITRTMLPS